MSFGPTSSPGVLFSLERSPFPSLYLTFLFHYLEMITFHLQEDHQSSPLYLLILLIHQDAFPQHEIMPLVAQNFFFSLKAYLFLTLPQASHQQILIRLKVSSWKHPFTPEAHSLVSLSGEDLLAIFVLNKDHHTGFHHCYLVFSQFWVQKRTLFRVSKGYSLEGLNLTLNCVFELLTF